MFWFSQHFQFVLKRDLVRTCFCVSLISQKENVNKDGFWKVKIEWKTKVFLKNKKNQKLFFKREKIFVINYEKRTVTLSKYTKIQKKKWKTLSVSPPFIFYLSFEKVKTIFLFMLWKVGRRGLDSHCARCNHIRVQKSIQLWVSVVHPWFSIWKTKKK